MGKKVEMIGKRFGRLIVLSETERRSASGAIYYLCKCDCGKEKIINGNNLRHNVSLSCGCYNREIITKADSVWKTKLYSIHQSMKSRCNNPKDKAFCNYGARGISVCKEWETFKPFQKWSYENGYVEGLWLDRIDNEKGYSPDNCRWVTPKIQQNNKRNNRYITINGVTKSVTMWAEENNLKPCTIYSRLNKGTPLSMLFEPIDKKRSHGEAIKRALQKRRTEILITREET